jgi:hypothetical protein
MIIMHDDHDHDDDVMHDRCHLLSRRRSSAAAIATTARGTRTHRQREGGRSATPTSKQAWIRAGNKSPPGFARCSARQLLRRFVSRDISAGLRRRGRLRRAPTEGLPSRPLEIKTQLPWTCGSAGSGATIPRMTTTNGSSEPGFRGGWRLSGPPTTSGGLRPYLQLFALGSGTGRFFRAWIV